MESTLLYVEKQKNKKKFLGGIFGAFVFDSFVMTLCK